jgi:hypothetical protein
MCQRASSSSICSTVPWMDPPALFTSMSMGVPLCSSSSMRVWQDWSVTSSGSHLPPLPTTSATRSGVLDGLRDVAITVSPWDWISRTRCSPRPDEQPVISQVRGRDGVVNLSSAILYECKEGKL